jgi:hypothetical protein
MSRVFAVKLGYIILAVLSVEFDIAGETFLPAISKVGMTHNTSIES